MSSTAIDIVEEVSRQIQRHRDTGWKELDPEKRAFGLAFLDSPTAVGASKVAGISASTGHKYHRDPVVRAYISDLQGVMEENSIINTRYINAHLENLLPILLGEEAAPVAIPGVGISMERKFYPAETLRCLDMLGKSIGFYNADITSGEGMMAAFAEMAARARARQETVTINGEVENDRQIEPPRKENGKDVEENKSITWSEKLSGPGPET